ncbi:hypothetical protein D3C81_1758360 [compost metagenome]
MMLSLRDSPNSEVSTPASSTERDSELPNSIIAAGNCHGPSTGWRETSGVTMIGTGCPPEVMCIQEPEAASAPRPRTAPSSSLRSTACSVSLWARSTPSCRDRWLSACTSASAQLLA